MKTTINIQNKSQNFITFFTNMQSLLIKSNCITLISLISLKTIINLPFSLNIQFVVKNTYLFPLFFIKMKFFLDKMIFPNHRRIEQNKMNFGCDKLASNQNSILFVTDDTL